MRGAQMPSGVKAAALAAQPLPVQEVSPGELESRTGTERCSIDRRYRTSAVSPSLSSARRRASIPLAQPELITRVRSESHSRANSSCARSAVLDAPPRAAATSVSDRVRLERSQAGRHTGRGRCRGPAQISRRLVRPPHPRARASPTMLRTSSEKSSSRRVSAARIRPSVRTSVSPSPQRSSGLRRSSAGRSQLAGEHVAPRRKLSANCRAGARPRLEPHLASRAADVGICHPTSRARRSRFWRTESHRDVRRRRRPRREKLESPSEVGAAGAYPSVSWMANASSSRSAGGGTRRVAPLGRRPLPPTRRRRPVVGMAPPSASRYVSRASSRRGPRVRPPPRAKRGPHRRRAAAPTRCGLARDRPGLARARPALWPPRPKQPERSLKIAGTRFAPAAARRRCARCAGSGVSATARSRKAAIAAKPPRACARPAESSSAVATSSLGLTPPAPSATRGDLGQSPDRSRSPGLGGQHGVPSARLPDTRPSEPADDETPLGDRAPTALPIRRYPQPTRGFRAARPPATPGPDRRPDQLRPPAASAARPGKLASRRV